MKEEAMPQELNPNVQFRGLVQDMSDVVDEAILNMLDSQHPDDRVLASLAEARGGVVRMNHALKIVNITVHHNDTLPEGAVPKPLALPKIKEQPGAMPSDTRKWEKQRPGIAKKLKSPRAFDCPTCHAEAGTNCFRFTNQGKNGKVTEDRNSGSTYHTARGALSVAHNDRVRREYDREMAKAHDHA